jgi:uncharacterized Zn-binding protein involved in type VI secretion
MGNPAARVGDLHVCPMVTPGVPPVPHVGGPILPPGCPTVLIGGQPAARVGDTAVCVGPPSSIIMGSPTVLIGGQPAARMGDPTAHGGTISIGFPMVLIGEAGAGGGGSQGSSGGALAGVAPGGPPAGASGPAAGLDQVGRPGKSSQVREVVGGESDARKVFDDLRGPNVPTQAKPGVFVAQMKDGGTVTFRARSKSGPPTVDVNQPGKKYLKIKFVPR